MAEQTIDPNSLASGVRVLPPQTVITAATDHTARTIAPDQLAAALAAPGTNVWIDLVNAGETGFDALRPALMFHPLVVEDCVTDINHPKVDDYRDYVYLAVHSARWEPDEAEPTLKELDVIVGPRYLVTYHEESTRSIDRAHLALERRGDLLSRGPDYLLYFLLDVMVDNYLPILEMLQERIDALEEKMLRQASRRTMVEVMHLKRGVSRLRRIVGPQRDTILALTRDEFSAIRPETRLYLRDVYDRMARVGDLLDLYRDEMATLLELYVSQVSNQLNEVMKVLTAITVIIVPVTLIASIYGMNVDFPGTGTRGGFWASLGIMAITAAGMLAYFRSRKWL
jgi:magnesium transporter